MKTLPSLLSLLLTLVFSSSLPGLAQAGEQYSSAGFVDLPGGEEKRQTFAFNQGWLYHKGDLQGAQAEKLADGGWEKVNLPHGLEILPEEASGCSNYQGVAWYRKHFTAPEMLDGKRVILYFEGIMGKCQIWVNGKDAGSHFGGYLPVVLDVGNLIRPDAENVIAVRADNSNDPTYPPGKPQRDLDFCYFGGIYRDAYLIVTDRIHITDPNEANVIAGGGVFFRTESYDPKTRKALTKVKVHIANDTDEKRDLIVNAVLTYAGDTEPYSHEGVLAVEGRTKGEIDLDVPVLKAKAWNPRNPHLYSLTVSVYDRKGKKAPSDLLDVCTLKVGIRTFSITAEKGLVLNGIPYPGKLMGGNRHQDFACLGNAVPNNLQWRDAVKMKAAGMEIVRSAHYPLDPAFMDACDALGMFVIVATPGWQFWGNGPFADRVYDDIRQMVRRDRNHPCVLMWEPILNETNYPGDFAKKAYDIVHEEYPGKFCYAACDSISRGAEHFDVMYAHPPQGELHWSKDEPLKTNKPYFTREFGDNVDDWSSHNSTSRASMAWGETPMLQQAIHYLKPPYRHTSWDAVYKAPPYHFGACLWHSFDHQRGYHPDPFYGGIMDGYRLPKFSFYAFKSQRNAGDPAKGGAEPMVYVAHECTPFSPANVTVFTNCETVRLTVHGKQPIEKKVAFERPGLPHPPVVFENVWNFMENKELTRGGKGGQVKIIAEGMINGKVVARDEVKPSRRASKIVLALDNAPGTLTANGSDVAVVVASMTDGNGTVKRLNNEKIVFTVEGPAEIIGNAENGANPRAVCWGTAPVLLRMKDKPGTVKVKAAVQYPGAQKPKEGQLQFEIAPSKEKMLNAVSALPGDGQ